MEKNLLEIKNLYKSYSSYDVLKGVNFQLKKGEIITILGKNGAGKSTLLNCILKLIHYDCGLIELNGKDIQSIGNKIYFNEISAVLENSENVYYYLTGEQNLIYFGGLYGLSKRNVLLNTKYWVDLFELDEHINKKVGDYSRGMIQKLALIIAMINKPKILLLDEPALGLDIFAKKNMLENLKKMVAQKDVSILLTTHQMDIVEYLDSNVLILDNGKVKYFGDIENIKLSKSDSYTVRYLRDNKEYEEIVKGMDFYGVYNYLETKNIDEIYEIKRNEKNLEQLILEMG